LIESDKIQTEKAFIQQEITAITLRLLVFSAILTTSDALLASTQQAYQRQARAIVPDHDIAFGKTQGKTDEDATYRSRAQEIFIGDVAVAKRLQESGIRRTVHVRNVTPGRVEEFDQQNPEHVKIRQETSAWKKQFLEPLPESSRGTNGEHIWIPGSVRNIEQTKTVTLPQEVKNIEEKLQILRKRLQELTQK
jgi:hypothetical protein